MDSEQRIEKLIKLNAQVLLGGGEKRIEGQHARGKKTARERFDMLFDKRPLVCGAAPVELFTSRYSHRGTNSAQRLRRCDLRTR